MVLEVDEVLFEEEPHEFGFTLRFAQKKAPQIRWRSRSFLNKFNEFSASPPSSLTSSAK